MATNFCKPIGVRLRPMAPHVLLTKLRAHLDRMPEMAGRGSYTTEHYAWLAKAHALVVLWNESEGMTFKNACDWAAGNLNRPMNLATVNGTLHRAIASLEESVPESEDQVFGPGAVYDFFRALNSIISSAEKSVFLIDPYVDDQIFDAYISSVRKPCLVRMLVDRYASSVKIGADRYRAQHGLAIEARKSSAIHDRLIFIDDAECWVLGASIKDAATSKPTYLAPLCQDVVSAKASFYESIWVGAQAI